MQLFSFLLNTPWNIIALIGSILSGPRHIRIHTHPLAIIITIRSFWWYTWLPGKKGVRAMTTANIIQISPLIMENDIEHELIHVEQAQRQPLVYPILYTIESWRYGYKNNKYEQEAYKSAGNRFVE